MYYSHFGLSAAPFQLTPTQGMPFLGRTHREALAALEWGLTDPNGFALLIGEPGTGKTSLILTLTEADHAGIRVIHVNRPIAFKEIVHLIAGEAGIAECDEPSMEFMRSFRERMASQKLRPVIIIDEAQGLADETLESLRLLANDAADGRFALQMILVGQPDLLNRLKRSPLRALDQRISTRAVLKRLERSEVHDYIDHRLQICGSSAAQLFSAAAIRALTRRGSRIPREINLLCHNSLILAYAAGRDRVDASMVRAAAAEYETQARSIGRSGLGGFFDRLRNFQNLSRGGLVIATLLGGAALGWPLAAHTRAAMRPRFSRPSVAAEVTVETPANDRARGEVARVDQSDGDRAAQAVTPTDRPAQSVVAPDQSAQSVAAPGQPAQPVTPTALERPAQPESSNSTSSDTSPLRAVVIEAGDNLSSIAEQYLGSKEPAVIQRLVAANPQISDMNLIHPGEIVHLPSGDK